eukprot:11408-Heterococcus_DN1.PRE.2
MSRDKLSINIGGAVESSFDLSFKSDGGECSPEHYYSFYAPHSRCCCAPLNCCWVSYSSLASCDVFRKGDLEISSCGVQKEGEERKFTLLPCAAKVLPVQHCSSRTTAAATAATQVINMFDKGKRDQLIREINALYNAQCDSLIRFYGAFYREGAITIALEYMDGGSLTNVLHQVHYTVSQDAACHMCTAVLLQIAPSGVENPHRVITVALQCTSALPALRTGVYRAIA